MLARRYENHRVFRPTYWSGGCGATGITLSASLQALTLDNTDETSAAADFSLSSNAVTINRAGVYTVECFITIEKTTATAWAEVRCLGRVNGSTYPNRMAAYIMCRNNGIRVTSGFGRHYTFASGDSFDVVANITSGSNVDQAGQGLVISLHRVSEV